MRISARGWKRDSGATLIMDRELTEATTRQVLHSYKPDVLYLDRTPKGVGLRLGPVPLTLGGRYQVEMQLTNEDIIELFLAITPDLSKEIENVFIARKQKLDRMPPEDKEE